MNYSNIEVNGSKSIELDDEALNPMITSLQILKLSSVEKCTGDVMFASFDNYDNSHSVSANLMKDIATYVRKNLGISKPSCLH